MDDGRWVSVILGIMGVGISVTLTLIGIIFSWLKGRIDKNEERIDKEIRELRQQTLDRLRSLGHEDREQKGNIDMLHKLIIEQLARRKKNGRE